MSESLLLQNVRVLLTQDSNRRIIRNVNVLIEDGKISKISQQPLKGEVKIDCSRSLAAPGLINSHTHIAMSLFRGVADDLPLKEWLYDRVWPMEGHLTPGMVRTGAMLGIAESIYSGITCFVDMYFYEDEIAEACVEAGVRGFLAAGYMDYGTPQKRDPDKVLSEAENYLKRWKDRNPLVVPCLGPHAPYSCSPELLEKTASLSERYDVPVHIHLAEDKDLAGQVKQKHGVTATELLRRTGLLDRRLITAHTIWVSDSDMRLLSRNNILVAHVPVTNVKMAQGIARVPEMLSHGVNVGLGTDGAGSNNLLDMFEVMKTAAIIHKQRLGDPTVLPAQKILDMATIIPARALGLPIGSIEEGREADIILVNLDRPWLTPLHNPVSQLVYSMRIGDVDTVLVAGRIVMLHGRIVTFNYEETIKKAERDALKLVEESRVESFLKQQLS